MQLLENEFNYNKPLDPGHMDGNLHSNGARKNFPSGDSKDNQFFSRRGKAERILLRGRKLAVLHIFKWQEAGFLANLCCRAVRPRSKCTRVSETPQREHA